MKIVRIFDNRDLFWCPCYPEDNGEDIITCLFEKWSDTEYLIDFFTNNLEDLSDQYWQSIDIDKAVDKVKEEAYCLEEKLLCIEYNQFGCIDVKITDIFVQFDKNEFILKREAEKFKKGKLDSLPQMLRLYAVELEDGTLIITGGAIKICKTMDREHLRREKIRMIRVNDYLKQQHIYTKKGLIN